MNSVLNFCSMCDGSLNSVLNTSWHRDLQKYNLTIFHLASEFFVQGTWYPTYSLIRWICDLRTVKSSFSAVAKPIFVSTEQVIIEKIWNDLNNISSRVLHFFDCNDLLLNLDMDMAFFVLINLFFLCHTICKPSHVFRRSGRKQDSNIKFGRRDWL